MGFDVSVAMSSAMGSAMSFTTAFHEAKQGNPGAIAALMNSTLQPRGICVTAETCSGNLHILLIARKPVPQEKLMQWMGRGLRALKLDMFPRVRVSVYLFGEELPLWIQEIPWPGLTPGSLAAEHAPERPRALRGKSWLLLGLLACLGGSAGGLLAWFVREGGFLPRLGASPQSPAAVAGRAPSSSPSPHPSTSSQQLQAQAYLAKMSQAQRAFYRQNSRFAASLEELERSASIIVRPGSYRYTLRVQQPEQADLVAVPQDEGLVSLRAIAVVPEGVADGEQPQRPLAAICVSTMATKDPLEPLLVHDRGLQCPSNSFLVPVP